jgi:hypothetical protein
MKRTQWGRQRLLQLSKSEKITAYLPATELIRAAQERTEGMVLYYREAVRNQILDWKQEWDYLERLARSCYLQGAQDTANVAAMMVNSGSDGLVSSGQRLVNSPPKLSN